MRADAQATSAVMVDPGEEAERLLAAVETLGVEIEAILVTHCHFDHIGAVGAGGAGRRAHRCTARRSSGGCWRIS